MPARSAPSRQWVLSAASCLLPQNGRELMAGLDRNLTPTLVRAAGKELATHLGKE